MESGRREHTQDWPSPRPDDAARAEIVELAKSGDRVAMESLWSLHRRWVAAVILAHKPAAAELDDILQEVAASMVANIRQVGQPGAFPGWLRTVAVNAARLAGRRASSGLARLGRVTGEAGESALASAAAPGPAAGAPHAPLDPETLLGLARRLPEGYGEALLLRALRGLSYAEIGAIMGLPESTVETRIARGRRMLRELATGQSTATNCGPDRQQTFGDGEAVETANPRRLPTDGAVTGARPGRIGR